MQHSNWARPRSFADLLLMTFSVALLLQWLIMHQDCHLGPQIATARRKGRSSIMVIHVYWEYIRVVHSNLSHLDSRNAPHSHEPEALEVSNIWGKEKGRKDKPFQVDMKVCHHNISEQAVLLRQTIKFSHLGFLHKVITWCRNGHPGDTTEAIWWRMPMCESRSRLELASLLSHLCSSCRILSSLFVGSHISPFDASISIPKCKVED